MMASTEAPQTHHSVARESRHDSSPTIASTAPKGVNARTIRNRTTHSNASLCKLPAGPAAVSQTVPLIDGAREPPPYLSRKKA